jgi:hypothetical protein
MSLGRDRNFVIGELLASDGTALCQPPARSNIFPPRRRLAKRSSERAVIWCYGSLHWLAWVFDALTGLIRAPFSCCSICRRKASISFSFVMWAMT